VTTTRRFRLRGRRDEIASSCGALVFSFALGMASLALPLLALREGYSVAAIGVLTAMSAVAQFGSRFLLGAAMRRWPDRMLINTAAILLVLSNVSVALSAAVAPFVVAELLQGSARACFWTGSQTHVVRRGGSSASALAVVNVAAAVGAMLGPIVAGVLSEGTPVLALWVAAVFALGVLGPSLVLDRLPPFAPRQPHASGRLWRRAGGDAGCWGSAAGGAWRALLGSYVPVVLDAARQSSSMIGVLTAVANAAAVVGSGLAGRLPPRLVAPGFLASTVATGAGTAATAAVAGHAPLAAVALAVSGLGAGVLTVLPPAVASDSVTAEERGDAINTTGIFRAGALFATPMAVAGLAGVVTVGPAMALVGGMLALPALTARSLYALQRDRLANDESW
jgi:MFS family permease